MANQCTTKGVVIFWIEVVISFILFCSSIYFIIKFIQNMRNQKGQEGSPKILNCAGLTFFMISALILFMWPFFILTFCYPDPIDGLFTLAKIAQFLYFPCQLYFLWLILFLNLYYIFKESAYELSKCNCK